jgi:hypothetical protein
MEPGVTLLSQTLTTTYVHTASAAVGQVVYVSAAGFFGSSNLSVSFNGEPVSWTVQPQTNSLGSYSPPTVGGAGFTVQPVPPGLYTVSVSDGFSHTATYTLNVFDASVSHSPTNGVSGSQLTFNGTGWPRNDTITMRLVPGNSSPLSLAPIYTLCSVTSDSTGTMPPQTCTIPAGLAAGTYSVYAADTYVSVYDATSYQMNPAISVFDTLTGPTGPSPIYNVAVGQAVTVSGTGWAPGTSLTATLGGNPIILSPVPSISSSGGFSGTGFTIPPGTGTTTLHIQDNNNLSANYVLHVYQPTFSYSPSTGIAGSNLTVSGSGWPVNDPVSVDLVTIVGSTYTIKGSPAVPACTVTSDGSGTIASQTCPVPTTVPAGTYTVLATDGDIQFTEPSFMLQPSIQTQSNTSLTTPTLVATAVHGSTVYLAGFGFAANSTITSVTLGATTIAFSDTTGATGSLSTNPRSFVVPSTVGTFTLTVKDASNNTATEQFTVT